MISDILELMTRSENNSIYEDAIGQVKFFKPSEGYGFLKIFDPEDMERDVFFHISGYAADSISKDSWMEFDIIESEEGLKAQDMRRVSQPPETELIGTSFNY